MSEQLPTDNENLDDQLQELLEQGGQSARNLLDRVDVRDPDELRAAIQLCQEHLVGKDWANMYVIDADGIALNLEYLDRLSVANINSVGIDEENNLYLTRKALE